MPELPEVETIRRGLEKLVRGRTIRRLEIFDERLVAPEPIEDVVRGVQGRTIERLERRGKYLLVQLSGDVTAVHHLRMTGALLREDGAQAPTHVRARYVLDGGPAVLYRDIRRFGTLVVGNEREIAARLDAALGPEPLGDRFTADVLRARVRGSRRPIKSALLDQGVVAGLGNIYADEALYAAGIRPTRMAGSLTRAEYERLARAIRAVLVEGIARGGSTLRDYANVEGGAGSMQDGFRVYGRAGEPCSACGTTIMGATIAGRTTAWCPSCQRMRGGA